MRLGMKAAAALLLIWTIAGCASTAHDTGKVCERCSYGYAPRTGDRSDRRSVCMIDGEIVNCDKIPAECKECARLQRYDMDRRTPPAR